MNNKWYTTKVKIKRYDDEGRFRSVTESYLVDAVSFYDAETRMTAILEEGVDGEFSFKSITKSPITDIVTDKDACQVYFLAKVKYVSVDDESGKEKPITNHMLVEAVEISLAIKAIHEYLKDMLVPYVIASIQESPIVEVIPFIPEDENDGEEDN